MLAVKLRVKRILDTSHAIKNLKFLVNSTYGLAFRLQLCVFMCDVFVWWVLGYSLNSLDLLQIAYLRKNRNLFFVILEAGKFKIKKIPITALL